MKEKKIEPKEIKKFKKKRNQRYVLVNELCRLAKGFFTCILFYGV